MLQHLACNSSQSLDAHQHYLRATKSRQRRIIDCAFRFGWIFVAGEECHVRVMGTVRDWNPRIRRSSDGRGNPRHNFEWNPRRRYIVRFFGASPEYEWIAAF